MRIQRCWCKGAVSVDAVLVADRLVLRQNACIVQNLYFSRAEQGAAGSGFSRCEIRSFQGLKPWFLGERVTARLEGAP